MHRFAHQLTLGEDPADESPMLGFRINGVFVLKVLARTPVPVYPVALSGLWGSTLSRNGKTVLGRVQAWRPFRKVRIDLGAPMAPETLTLEELQQRVAQLRRFP